MRPQSELLAILAALAMLALAAEARAEPLDEDDEQPEEVDEDILAGMRGSGQWLEARHEAWKDEMGPQFKFERARRRQAFVPDDQVFKPADESEDKYREQRRARDELIDRLEAIGGAGDSEADQDERSMRDQIDHYVQDGAKTSPSSRRAGHDDAWLDGEEVGKSARNNLQLDDSNDHDHDHDHDGQDDELPTSEEPPVLPKLEWRQSGPTRRFMIDDARRLAFAPRTG